MFPDPIHGLLNGLTEISDAFGNSSDPNYRVGVLTRDTYYGNGFGGSGFLPKFSDPSNQIRHFVGWFAAGAYHPGPVARRLLYSQEGTRNQNDPDVALGLQAINMGIEFSKTKDHRALAKGIWRDVCGGNTPLQLPLKGS